MKAGRVTSVIVLTISTGIIEAQTLARQLPLPYPVQVVHMGPIIPNGRAIFSAKALDTEATARMREQAARVLVRCKGSDYLLTGQDGLQEVKGVKLVVSQMYQNKVDSMNGVEWLGHISISGEYARVLNEELSTGEAGWDEWTVGRSFLGQDLKRMRGVWYLDDEDWARPGVTLSCSLVEDLISGRVKLGEVNQQAEEKRAAPQPNTNKPAESGPIKRHPLR